MLGLCGSHLRQACTAQSNHHALCSSAHSCKNHRKIISLRVVLSSHLSGTSVNEYEKKTISGKMQKRKLTLQKAVESNVSLMQVHILFVLIGKTLIGVERF